jgi:hypothetical protein
LHTAAGLKHPVFTDFEVELRHHKEESGIPSNLLIQFGLNTGHQPLMKIREERDIAYPSLQYRIA